MQEDLAVIVSQACSRTVCQRQCSFVWRDETCWMILAHTVAIGLDVTLLAAIVCDISSSIIDEEVKLVHGAHVFPYIFVLILLAINIHDGAFVCGCEPASFMLIMSHIVACIRVGECTALAFKSWVRLLIAAEVP